MTYSKLFLITILALTFVVPSLALGQNTTSQEQRAMITRLQEQIKALEVQLATLTKQIEGQNKEIEKIKIEVAFTKVLQRGMTGDEVKKLQTFLKQFPEIYPEGLVTGYYGSLTEAAVRRLQEKQGLETVGFIGPKTLEKLNTLAVTNTSAIPLEPVTPSKTGTSTSPLPELGTTGGTATTTAPACIRDYSACSSKGACEEAKFFWYTLSCHPTPPPQGSCAASYNYCRIGVECSTNGWYSCRNSCYGSAEACLGQAYVPLTVPSPVSTQIPSSGSGSANTTGTTPLLLQAQLPPLLHQTPCHLLYPLG